MNITAATDLRVDLVRMRCDHQARSGDEYRRAGRADPQDDRRAKDLLPGLKLARFGEVWSDEGSLRHNHNMRVCTGASGSRRRESHLRRGGGDRPPGRAWRHRLHEPVTRRREAAVAGARPNPGD